MSNFSTAAMPSFLNTRPARHDFVHGLAGAGLGLSVLHLVDGGEANIDAAATGATIAICPGAYVENLTIAKDIRLVGAGDENGTRATILQGAGATSVVNVQTANVVLQNLRITGGRNARLQLTNSESCGNAADNDGGIDVHDGADVRFDVASRVTENRANMAGGPAVDLCSGIAGPR